MLLEVVLLSFCQLSVGIRQRIAFYERQESFRKGTDKAITEVVLDTALHVMVTSRGSSMHGSVMVKKQGSVVTIDPSTTMPPG